jgi:hypothetical protein
VVLDCASRIRKGVHGSTTYRCLRA